MFIEYKQVERFRDETATFMKEKWKGGEKKNNLVIIHSETSDFKGILKKLLKWVAKLLMAPKKIIQRHWKEKNELPVKEFITYLTDAASDGNVIYG